MNTTKGFTLRELLVAVLIIGILAAGALFAQIAKPGKSALPKLEYQVRNSVFEKAFNDYRDLIKSSEKAPAKKQKQALLKMARSYMQLSTMARIEQYSLYFQGRWFLVDEVSLDDLHNPDDSVDARDFLAEQKKLLSQKEQEEYAVFLKQVDQDIADYYKLHRPAMDGVSRIR